MTGCSLYVDPNSNAKQTAAQWRSQGRTADAANLDKIGDHSVAEWYGNWIPDVRSAVSSKVTSIIAARSLPVLVAYNIPFRDCGGFSSGGSASATAYRAWIREFAEGIGSRLAWVILEPDALASLDCLPAAGQAERLDLIKDAVSVLRAKPGVSVYIDAGNSGWQSVATMVSRLNAAGISQARGFSLNVSNFKWTADETAYGSSISLATGNKKFVIDTSRNGSGPYDGVDSWCNPPGRSLGTYPVVGTANPLIDAYLWIKRVGESDGTCRGGPSAGTWWPEYALGLAQRTP